MEFLANAFFCAGLTPKTTDPMRLSLFFFLPMATRNLQSGEVWCGFRLYNPLLSSDGTRKSSGNSKKKVNDSDNKLLVNEKQSKKNTEVPPEECKMPLVWIDLEMTGLNVEVDRILEIACIVTDGRLTKIGGGIFSIVH
nr:uncharacterized protein LOC114823207 [Malus domestica]